MNAADNAAEPALDPPAAAPADRLAHSVSEAAALLGVSRVTVWRWIRTGRLPVTRLGHRTVRIRRDDLERLLHERVMAQVGSADAESWVARMLDSGTTNGNGAAAGHAQPFTGHAVQFYETDAFLLDAVAAYIGAALTAGEAGVVIATPAHRTGLVERLQRAGVDIDAARAAGRYLALDAAETLVRFMADDLPDAGRFVEVVGGIIAQGTAVGRNVRAFGEMVALLVAEGNQAAALRLEALWNSLQQTYHFSLLCAYPMESLDGAGHAALFDGVCAEHTLVMPAESYTALAAPDERLRAVVRLQQKARRLEVEIQERKRVEAELRQSEQELADFFDNAVEGLHWVGPDGIILRVNRAELDLLGYSHEEYVGHHIAEFHLDQDVITDILARLARGETVRDCEARLRCKDGSIKHVLINSNALWRDGEFIHSRCFTRDITDRRQAEEVRQRLAAIVESSEDAIIGKTLDAVITNWNAAAERMYGYSAEEAIGRSIGMLVPPDRPDELPTIMARLRRGERIANYETERVRKDGARLAVALTISPIRDTNGVLVGASTIARDITERKRVEAALQEAAAERDQALAKAQAALRMRDEFLSSISHDLRTPLSSVKGLAQLLLRQAARAPTLESTRVTTALSTIDAATSKMTAMIDELLDLMRLDAGQPLDLDYQSTDLALLLRQAAAEFQRGAPQHQIVVETDRAALCGMWDPVRLDRVVSNLLSNAIKYSPDGGQVTVTLACEEAEQGAWATLTVEDEGLGIPAADLPHIFDRFHRGANVTGQIRGVGIGLAGCKQIVELHGGSIAIASEEGVGTTVTVRLPCTADEPVDEAAEALHT